MSTQISGQITVTTAGTAVQGPNLQGGAFQIRALGSNTGYMYIGNDGNDDVDSNTGYKLAATDGPVIIEVTNLNQLWFDASVNGEKVCWLRIEV